ncbi:hypothetical protein, partial [Streptomyces sp. NPDC052015]|uniref:hypothetical protein n=1 Tax=Streptomyces sp. NPDC052015 TaxID=3154755 RepID=UPI0034336CCE
MTKATPILPPSRRIRRWFRRDLPGSGQVPQLKGRALDRADGSLATLSIEGQPDRAVALKRRDTAEL